jgi:hypothetical protein
VLAADLYVSSLALMALAYAAAQARRPLTGACPSNLDSGGGAFVVVVVVDVVLLVVDDGVVVLDVVLDVGPDAVGSPPPQALIKTAVDTATAAVIPTRKDPIPGCFLPPRSSAVERGTVEPQPPKHPTCAATERLMT